MFLPTTSLLLLAASGAVATFPTRVLFQSPIFLENIAVRPSSQLLLTSVVSPTLHTLDPTAQNITFDEIYTFPNATALTGIVEYRPDVYAVVASQLNSTTRVAEAGSVVIWSVDFTSGTPIPRAVARIPQSTLTNGLSNVPGHPDLVLAADSHLGAAYEINMRTSAMRVRIQDPAMAPGAPPPALGINGLHAHLNHLYFANSQLGTFNRVSLAGGAVEMLGNITKFAVDGTAYDDFAIDEQGRAFVGMHPGAVQLFYQSKDGSWVQETVAGDTNGSAVVTGPTSAAFGRRCGRHTKTLYVTTAGGNLVAVDTSRQT
ncbi:hypothetical protein R3P38DRAFT_2844000 [Favolaschia claudopus]|uniref:SMP-30/Gluconolactonase/LRE-like region domain-containing protein n=1 Tax=Favolaschia claudopus TaxID=2862362 RepID=A0AAW0E5N9_9AGAR